MIPRISLPRLRDRLERLAAIGREADGGITRLPFTDPHREAVRYTAALMHEAGLTPGVDPFGILIGVAPGREDRPHLLAGSHLDSVPHGGMFDGALGVLAAVECGEALREAGVSLRHPFAAVAFADEEGAAFDLGMLSSRCLVGAIPRERFATIRGWDGRTLAAVLSQAQAGLPAAMFPERVAAYVELHVEQGPGLHRSGKRVAAVEAITGQMRTLITFQGRANHAGTTPMDMRADALCGAAEMVLAVRDAATSARGLAVGTVGRAEVAPGVTNIVPGRATISVDLRSPEPEELRVLQARVEGEAGAIASRLGLEVTIAPWDENPRQPMDRRVIESILGAIEAQEEERLTMPSWAGHDAQILAAHVPAAMIFVTSTDGISHSPLEHTPWQDVELGAQVLLEALLRLDREDLDATRLPLAYA